MARYPSSMKTAFVSFCLFYVLLQASIFVSARPATFLQDFRATWSEPHIKQIEGGRAIQLILDQNSGCGFASKYQYLFGRVSMKIKLIPGDSAGTVTAFYMNSDTDNVRDELDFEFLGNRTGQPYTVQTNVYAHGKGDREQRINLWFDPAADFHTYSILWNHRQVVFYVDEVPVRVYKNNEAKGIPFPKFQPMGVYSTLWEADDWATRGGLEKIDWSKAPFYAYYKDFDIEGCPVPGPSFCPSNTRNWWESAAYQQLSAVEAKRYEWVRMNHMTYDYCNDISRYWRFHLSGETEEEFSTRLAKNLEDLILKEGPDTIAAFIAEPVMGAGGVIPPPATYFEKIQAVVKKYDILFIADEVICAFGRLGTMYGCDKYGIKPDLVSLAKALSSAYMPIGAILVSPEISDVIHSQSSELGIFSHGFTYSGHPVSCAVAIEALKIYKERNIVEKVKNISPKFQDGLKAFSDSPIIGEIRGTGLISGTEFTDNKSPNDPFPSKWGVGAYFGAQCEKNGMLVRVAGDNILMSPPFIISPEEVDELISKYGKALKATEERVMELKSQQK